MLRSLFSCCLSTRSKSLDPPKLPDENTHLIPATADDDSTPSLGLGNGIGPNSGNRQTINERMSSIVKAKEGKMVNVSSRLPFNLSNKKMYVRIGSGYSSTGYGYSDPSSSRSISTGNKQTPVSGLLAMTPGVPSPLILSDDNPLSLSGVGPVSASASIPTAFSFATTGPLSAHVGAPLTPSASTSNFQILQGNRNPPSRSSSQASRSRETSAHDSSKSASMGTGRVTIFNARLVRGFPMREVAAAASKRGRAARRKVEAEVVNGTPAEGPISSMGPSSSLDGPPRVHSYDSFIERTSLAPEQADSGVSTSVHDATPKVNDSVASIPISSSSLSISPASTSSIGFKLKNAGPLVASWGD